MSYPPRPGSANDKREGGDFAKFIHIWPEGKKGSFISPSGNKGFQGRILPCFDFSFQTEDPAFVSSYAAYRYDKEDEEEHAPFSNWYFPFYIHSWYGRNKRTFFSPKSLRRLGVSQAKEDTYDPIDSINYHVHKESKWDHWKDKRVGTLANPAIIPMPSDISVFNVYGSYSEKEPQNHLLWLRKAGMDHVLDLLNQYRNPSKKALDPNWSDYMFGDVTDPETGLFCWSSQCMMQTGKTANTLAFSKKDETSDGAKAMSVPKEALTGRYNFYDIENTIHISTPAEIVQYLLEDGDVPLELIKEACGHFVDVPDAPTKPKTQGKPPGAYQEPPKKSNPRPSGVPATKAETKDWDGEDPDDDIPFTFPDKEDAKEETVSAAPQASYEEVLALLAKNGISTDGLK